MPQPLTASSVFRDLFAPSSETREERERDGWDHAADYVETTYGAWDGLRVANHALTAAELCLPASHGCREAVGRAKEVSNIAGIALSGPLVISEANNVRHSANDLRKAQNLPYSDPLRTRKIIQAGKKTFIDSMNLTNTVAQIALCVDNAKIYLFQTAPLRIIDGIYNLTSFITDGTELVGEYSKLKRYYAPAAQPLNPLEATKLQQKKTLAWIVIAKDAASLAMATFTLVTLAFAIATSTMAVVSVSLLAVSAFWLTMKLSAHFYSKVIVEAPPPALA